MEHAMELPSSPSPRTKDDGTHTSYEFTLPYTTRHKNNTESQGQHEHEHEEEEEEEELPRPDDEVGEEELALRARGLSGKFVDDFGNVLDWDGTVLGSVQGDLPSMLGRPVERSGYVMDSDGEIVGYVDESYVEQQPGEASSPEIETEAEPETEAEGGEEEPQGLDNRGLRVDAQGNIFDQNGEIVGKMKKNVPGQGPSSQTRENQGQDDDDNKAKQGKGKQRPSSTPSPSEVYLDVKSTHDGIQLIIKIPTVFNPNQESK